MHSSLWTVLFYFYYRQIFMRQSLQFQMSFLQHYLAFKQDLVESGLFFIFIGTLNIQKSIFGFLRIVSLIDGFFINTCVYFLVTQRKLLRLFNLLVAQILLGLQETQFVFETLLIYANDNISILYIFQETKNSELFYLINETYNSDVNLFDKILIFGIKEIIIFNLPLRKGKMDLNDVSFKNLEKCPYCGLPFERTPKAQPRIMYCGHTVCSQCIKNQVKKNNGLICILCKKFYKKADCAKFQINNVYLDLIDCLDYHFGKQLNDQIQSIGGLQQFNIFSGIQGVSQDNIYQNKDQLKKCRNSPCQNISIYAFCSQHCQNHFEQVSTQKDEGNNFMRRNNEFVYDI